MKIFLLQFIFFNGKLRLILNVVNGPQERIEEKKELLLLI